jgi:hypothetical protein
VDAVLVTSTAVIPIEFKAGAKKFQQADYEQAWDFRLDLKNFHAPSHAAAIFPLLCATDAPKSERRWRPPAVLLQLARPRQHDRLGRLAEFSRLASFGFFSLALQPLRIKFTDVAQVALDAAMLLEQLLADRTHLRHDRIVLLIDDGLSGHGRAPSGP